MATNWPMSPTMTISRPDPTPDPTNIRPKTQIEQSLEIRLSALPGACRQEVPRRQGLPVTNDPQTFLMDQSQFVIR